MIEHWLYELSAVFIISFIVAFLAAWLKQPPILGYIIAGTILGPLFLNIIKSEELFTKLSHIGIAFLLYIVGLHLNPREIKKIGYKAFKITFLQIFITTILSFAILKFFIPFLQALISAFAISLSSTIIILKIISDKNESEELYSRILLGILLVQDLFATLFLITLSSINRGGNTWEFLLKLALLSVKIILTIIILRILINLVFHKLIDRIAKSQELLFLFAISWCFFISSLFFYSGLSMEVGALIAGVLLSTSPYRLEISSRIKPIKDFFLILFFLLLGIKVTNLEANSLWLIAVLTIIVIVIKPLIVWLILKYYHYSKEVRFLTSTALSQISEFSLIILILGESYHLISKTLLSTITIVTILTIIYSSYIIKYNNEIFHYLVRKGILKYTFKPTLKEDSHYDIIIFGYDRIGFSLLKMIKKLNKRYLVIDYDPDVITKLKRNGISCIYGDANDVSLLDTLTYHKTKLVISTIPDYETNKMILKKIREKNPSTFIILTSHNIDKALDLYKKGADYVILPHFLGGEYVSSLIGKHFSNLNEILKEKIKHINELEKRKREGLEHPEYKK